MGVRPAESERAHTSAAGDAVGLPRLKLRAHEERARGEIDLWVGPREVEARGRVCVAERERRLHQPGHARRGVGVADIRLERAESAVLPACAPETEGPRERRDFDRVAERRRRPVRLDKPDSVGADASQGMRRRDDGGLPSTLGAV